MTNTALEAIASSSIKNAVQLSKKLFPNWQISHSLSHFPSRFKKALVTPLLKKRDLDTENPANYRPISNLNTISKVIERLVLVKMHYHIIQCPNFNILQSAYKKTTVRNRTSAYIK